jgi:hypothetical protein
MKLVAHPRRTARRRHRVGRRRECERLPVLARPLHRLERRQAPGRASATSRSACRRSSTPSGRVTAASCATSVVDGSDGVPLVAYDGTSGGLSGDGRRLVVASYGPLPGAAGSDPLSDRPRRNPVARGARPDHPEAGAALVDRVEASGTWAAGRSRARRAPAVAGPPRSTPGPATTRARHGEARGVLHRPAARAPGRELAVRADSAMLASVDTRSWEVEVSD